MATTREVLARPPLGAVEQDALAVELRRQLRASLPDAAGPLARAAEHAVASPGKLVRPLLLLDACRAVGGDPEVALPAAIGTELGHIASLVHDDIIDGDAERRGRPAVHARFGLPLAILTGDFLVFETFLCYSQCAERGAGAERTLAAIRTLSRTCLELCRGQALEATLAGDPDVSVATYLEVIRLKTASVCRATAEIGACLGGGSAEAIAALGAYGEALGLAFQIVDDVLCYGDRADQLGKPPDSDLRNGRVTLPLVYALRAGPSVREAVLGLLAGPVAERARAHARLAALLRSSGALARARACAASYTEAAKRHLDRLPPTSARARLLARADELLGRAR
jgi:geranylgeranyl diphosphate synthase, type I